MNAWNVAFILHRHKSYVDQLNRLLPDQVGADQAHVMGSVDQQERTCSALGRQGGFMVHALVSSGPSCGRDDLHRVGLLFDDANFWNAGASALFIAGRNGRTTRKRSFKEGAVPRQGVPARSPALPASPLLSPCFGIGKDAPRVLNLTKSRNNLSDLV